ncbi:hypothetical protein [Kribbella endophytica]
MPMQTLMTGPAWVSYAQIYVESSDDPMPELSECFGGQQNGLCGAAVPGTLFLITGLHTGNVGFAVELHDEEPPLDDTWEEIVEASYRPAGEVALNGWGGEGRWPLALDPIDYRVRYSGWGMDTGHQSAGPMDDEPLVDRYLLQFWPAPPAPDRVLKQTSAQAAYWHGFARETPPRPTPEQRAEQQQERERQRENEQQAANLAAWGGTLPSERLQEIWKAFHLASDYRPLLDAADAATPDTQWAIARWITRSMCVESGLIQYDWIAAALDRLENGHEDKWSILQIPVEAFNPPLTEGARFTAGGYTNTPDLAGQATAIFSTFFYDDPLRAVVDALWIARDVYGPDRAQVFLDDLWRDFPMLQLRRR